MERASLPLPVKFGRLGLQNLCEIANTELLNSKEIARELYENFITQNKDFHIDSETGSPNWLRVIPMCQLNYFLNKQQFSDSIRLPYGWPTLGLPVSCSCGEGINVQYVMSCKRGGREFITLRHNEVRDITAALLSDVCKDVKLEPSFLALNGKEQTMRKIAKMNDEIRLAICARSFWESGQKTFFDVRFFDPIAQSYSKQTQQTLKQSYSMNKNEKKRHYNTRIMEVDQGSFTPLVFTVAGGIGGEGRAFYS